MSYIPTTTLPFPELASALPLEDVVALGGLVGARLARIWTRNRIEECKKQLDALIAIHNSIAPINTLPNELLMKIFASIPVFTWRSAPWMLTLGHICRRWRAVVLATSEFWVKPLEHWADPENDDEQNHLLPVFLERSSPCPLQLNRFEPRSGKSYHGWAAHFGRLIVLEAYAESNSEVPAILRKVTSKMRRLERFKLEISGWSYEEVSTAELDLRQWKAESLPYLGRLEISGDVFCRATTVPSLHTLILQGPRGPKSLSSLLDGLEGCPALATLRLKFGIWMDDMDEGSEAPTPDCVLDLPNLRRLTVAGRDADIYRFLSCISFPASDARIRLIVNDADDERQSVLPNILPTRLSILHMSPTIDRLFLQSDVDYEDVPFLSMRGYVHGAERLGVSPVLWIHSADRLLQLLEVFGACTVTELALDLRRNTSDMGGEFWGRFFAAFPHLRRLQLLSYTLESKETKRDIAEHFLASSRGPQQAAHAISLAWVLRADRKNPSHLKEELGDVKQVLGGHAQQGARLGRLELYATSREPGSCKPEYDYPQVVDVTQVWFDRTSKWLLMRDYVSRLADAVEVVTVGGQLKLRTVDGDGEEDEFEGDGTDGDDALEEWCSEENKDEDEDEEEAGSSNDTW